MRFSHMASVALATSVALAWSLDTQAESLDLVQSRFTSGKLGFNVSGITLDPNGNPRATIVIENQATAPVQLAPAFVEVAGVGTVIDLSIANEVGVGCRAQRLTGINIKKASSESETATAIPARARMTVAVEFHCPAGNPIADKDVLAINGSFTLVQNEKGESVPVSFWGLTPRKAK